MNFLKRFVMLPLIAVTAVSNAPAREISRVITAPCDSFVIHVEGTAEPVTRAIIIENVGETEVVNPVLTANGHGDWFDKQAMVKDILNIPGLSDRDRAMVLWQFWWRNRFPMTPPGDALVLDPVVFMNVYGYGNCGCSAAAIVTLAEAAGLKARIWEVYDSKLKSGHTVSEFFYDGRWHLFDADQGFFYLKKDNRTVASIEEVQNDSTLILRTIDRRSRALEHYGFYRNPKDRYVQDYYDRWRLSGHTMALTLRPGEKLERSPLKSPLFYDCWNRRQYKPKKAWGFPPDIYGSGLIRYRIPLPRGVRGRNLVPGKLPDGSAALVVKNLMAKRSDRCGQLMIRCKSPYVIVGGRLKGAFYRHRNTPLDYVSVEVGNAWTKSEDNPEGFVPVWGAAWRREIGRLQAAADYTHLFQFGEKARGRNRLGIYEYTMRIRMGAGKAGAGATDGGKRVDSPGITGVETLELTSYIQVAPNSLPTLKLGDNKIVYRDETTGARKVKITYVWEECRDNHPPKAPAGPLSPRNGSRVGTERDLVLSWKPAVDPDKGDKVTAYHLQVSYRPDCLYPVTRPLDREIEGGVNSWKFPRTWLTPRTTYYWRVRARDQKGDWGPWSPVWSFRTRGR